MGKQEVVCAAENCQARAACKGYCNSHYQRWFKYGDPSAGTWRRPNDGRCAIEGCTKPPRSPTASWCEMHYYRNRRHRPLRAPELQRNQTGRCAVAGCDRSPVGIYCLMHYTRVYRHGSPDVRLPPHAVKGPQHPWWKGDEVSYAGVHRRLRIERGHPQHCDHCGSEAKQTYHWALDRSRARTVRHDEVAGLPFSTDLTAYVRLCVSCHKQFDLEHKATGVASQNL